jgi:hypothetical protein
MAGKWMIFGAVALVSCAPTHTVSPAAAGGQLGVRMGETAQLGGSTVTPVSVEEDSRCPRDVQCIQAGTVRVQVRLHNGTETRTSSVGLRAPIQLDAGWLHLASVCPPRISTAALSAADYRFTFVMSPSAAEPPVEPGC